MHAIIIYTKLHTIINIHREYGITSSIGVKDFLWRDLADMLLKSLNQHRWQDWSLGRQSRPLLTVQGFDVGEQRGV